jgi:hypothetical protein
MYREQQGLLAPLARAELGVTVDECCTTVELKGGERITLTGEGLRRAAPGLAPKAAAALALRRGSVVRVMQMTPTSAGAAAASAAVHAAVNPARLAGAAAVGVTWALVQWPEAQAAFVALDPATGRTRALVGGFDFSRQPFNHATQAWRQPGYSFKPLLFSAAQKAAMMPRSAGWRAAASAARTARPAAEPCVRRRRESIGKHALI